MNPIFRSIFFTFLFAVISFTVPSAMGLAVGRDASNVCELTGKTTDKTEFSISVPNSHYEKILGIFGGVNWQGCVSYLRFLIVSSLYQTPDYIQSFDVESAILIRFLKPGDKDPVVCRLKQTRHSYPTVPESLKWATEPGNSWEEIIDRIRALYEFYKPQLDELVDVECPSA